MSVYVCLSLSLSLVVCECCFSCFCLCLGIERFESQLECSSTNWTIFSSNSASNKRCQFFLEDECYQHCCCCRGRCRSFCGRWRCRRRSRTWFDPNGYCRCGCCCRCTRRRCGGCRCAGSTRRRWVAARTYLSSSTWSCCSCPRKSKWELKLKKDSLRALHFNRNILKWKSRETALLFFCQCFEQIFHFKWK